MERPAKRNLFDDDSDGDDYMPGGIGANDKLQEPVAEENTQPTSA